MTRVTHTFYDSARSTIEHPTRSVGNYDGAGFRIHVDNPYYIIQHCRPTSQYASQCLSLYIAQSGFDLWWQLICQPRDNHRWLVHTSVGLICCIDDNINHPLAVAIIKTHQNYHSLRVIDIFYYSLSLPGRKGEIDRSVGWYLMT